MVISMDVSNNNTEESQIRTEENITEQNLLGTKDGIKHQQESNSIYKIILRISGLYGLKLSFDRSRGNFLKRIQHAFILRYSNSLNEVGMLFLRLIFLALEVTAILALTGVISIATIFAIKVSAPILLGVALGVLVVSLVGNYMSSSPPVILPPVIAEQNEVAGKLSSLEETCSKTIDDKAVRGDDHVLGGYNIHGLATQSGCSDNEKSDFSDYEGSDSSDDEAASYLPSTSQDRRSLDNGG